MAGYKNKEVESSNPPNEWKSAGKQKWIETFSVLLVEDDEDVGIGGAGPLIEVLTAANGCPDPEEFWVALWSSETG